MIILFKIGIFNEHRKNYLSKINNFSFFMKYLIIFLKIGVFN